MDTDKKIFISASEIGDFLYCKRSWWLRYNGKSEASDRMITGSLKHAALANQLTTNRIKISFAKYLIIFAILCLIAVIVYTLLVT